MQQLIGMHLSHQLQQQSNNSQFFLLGGKDAHLGLTGSMQISLQIDRKQLQPLAAEEIEHACSRLFILCTCIVFRFAGSFSGGDTL